MKTLKIFLGLVATAALLSSCMRESSSSVDQDLIWVGYELFYNANEDKTYARSTFKFSNIAGTHLELAADAKIEFNGAPLTWQPALAYYQLEFAGLVESGEFEYTDLDNFKYANTVEIKNEIQFPVLDSIGRSTASSIVWLGETLDEFESVILTVNGKNERDLQIFEQSDLGSNSIILDKDKLGRLPQGIADFYMDRLDVQEPASGTSASGLVTAKYRASNSQAYLK